MLFASVATGIREGDVARFPAVRAIIEAVRAELDLILAFANGAVFFARAVFFRLVTQGTHYRTRHERLQENCT
jgi:hypothetical protein